MTFSPAPLLFLGALCSVPALLALWLAAPDTVVAPSRASSLVGVGSVLGLALLVLGLWPLLGRAWQDWRQGRGAAGLLRWAGLALLAWPLLLTDLLGLTALSGNTLAVSVTYASAGAMYASWALWLALALGLLWMGRARV